MSDDTLDPDAPLTFREAAEHCLRGTVKGATLRAAWERRELTAERLGRRVVTTPAAVAEWRKRCRVPAEPKPLVSMSVLIGALLEPTNEPVRRKKRRTPVRH